MIRTIGLFWNVSDVYWGAGRQPGRLLGVPKKHVTADAIDFREQIAIYVLYADYDLIYAGQTGTGRQRLLDRLKLHLRDDLAGRWNRFSWFGVRRVNRDRSLSAEAQAAHPPLDEVLNHMEAIIIHTAEPPLNRQGGRWGAHVEWYVQRRDPRLGPTDSEKISEIWQRTMQDE